MLGSTHKIYSSILIFIIIWRFWCRCHCSRSRYENCTSLIFSQMLQCCQYLTSSLGLLKQGFCHFVALIFAGHKYLETSVPSARLALNQIYCTIRTWSSCRNIIKIVAGGWVFFTFFTFHTIRFGDNIYPFKRQCQIRVWIKSWVKKKPSENTMVAPNHSI